jgi:protein gp37
MIFVNSMSDLFHEGVPDDYIIDVTKIMVKADWHVFQVLTKRSERERDMLNTKLSFAKDFRHIWWGVSCENKNQGVPRIAHLQAADVRVRIISFEPLLEDLGELNLKGIHWGIGGGESGGRANFPCRPCDIQWLRNLRDQCVSQGVPYFLKQLGGHPNKRGGDEAVLDGRRWTETPELSKL